MIRPELTVAAVIEGTSDPDQREGQFLVVEEIVRGKPVFNQPAGHVETNESPLEAVIREVLEETAWSFRPSHVVGAYLWQSPRTHDHILRIAVAGEVEAFDADAALDDPIVATHWMRLDQIRDCGRLRSPFVLRCVEDYLAGCSAPLDTVHLVR